MRTSRHLNVSLNEALHEPDVGLVEQRLDLDHLAIDARAELTVDVIDIRYAAAHTGREVPPGLAQNHHRSASHVLAAVVASALDNRASPTVSHCEALACDAVEEDLAASRPIQRRIANQDVLMGNKARVCRWTNGDAASREALAQVVIRVAFQVEAGAPSQERSKRLPCRPCESDNDGVVRQTLLPLSSGDGPGHHGPNGSVGVLYVSRQLDGSTTVNRTLRIGEQADIHVVLKAAVHRLDESMNFTGFTAWQQHICQV